MEGGYDRPYEPATCYSPTVALGRHEGPGDAADLWNDYEKVVALVPSMGLDGVRLNVEWARIEPHYGQFDHVALERYVNVARRARSLDLAVTVALVDAAWPAWLGLEAWLLPWVEEAMLTHSRRVAAAFEGVATGVVVFANESALVKGGYLDATRPPWRRGAKNDAAFASAQLARITETLRADPVVGPLLVRTWRTLTLSSSLDAVRRARSAALDGNDLYVRSLVRGAGPTSAPTGLLARRDGDWVVDASKELLDALA